MEQIKYVNEKVVADITGYSVQTLRNDRHIGKGIPYTKRDCAWDYSSPEVWQRQTR